MFKQPPLSAANCGQSVFKTSMCITYSPVRAANVICDGEHRQMFADESSYEILKETFLNPQHSILKCATGKATQIIA